MEGEKQSGPALPVLGPALAGYCSSSSGVEVNSAWLPLLPEVACSLSYRWTTEPPALCSGLDPLFPVLCSGAIQMIYFPFFPSFF